MKLSTDVVMMPSLPTTPGFVKELLTRHHIPLLVKRVCLESPTNFIDTAMMGAQSRLSLMRSTPTTRLRSRFGIVLIWLGVVYQIGGR